MIHTYAVEMVPMQTIAGATTVTSAWVDAQSSEKYTIQMYATGSLIGTCVVQYSSDLPANYFNPPPYAPRFYDVLPAMTLGAGVQTIDRLMGDNWVRVVVDITSGSGDICVVRSAKVNL